MAIHVILIISILLQFASAILALRLIPLTGKRAAWILISCAIFLMTVRRAVTFVHLVGGQKAPGSFDLSVELIALLISVLMFAGIASLAPLFKTIDLATTSLKASDRMKSELISTAAHELKTPLTSILGYTEILLNPQIYGLGDGRKQQELLKEIYAKGEALAGIVDSMLDLHRIESGMQIPLDIGEHNLSEALEKEVEFFQLNHSTHELRFVQTSAHPIPARCDLHKIIQVLENLLNNAVKYSPAGSHIRVELGEREGDVQISVADEGIGMSEEVLARVFDKFYRDDASNTAVQGFGLGMNIVKQIVEAHGGQVRIESAPKAGTLVRCILPTQFAPPAPPPDPNDTQVFPKVQAGRTSTRLS